MASNANPIAAGFESNLNQSQLQNTVVVMASTFNHMVSAMVIGNAMCTQFLNDMATNITADMNSQFETDYNELKNDEQYNPNDAGKRWHGHKLTSAEIQKNIALMQANMNEMQSVAQSSSQSVSGIAEDTNNKVNELTQSGQQLISSATTIDNTILQSAQQAANGISA